MNPNGEYNRSRLATVTVVSMSWKCGCRFFNGIAAELQVQIIVIQKWNAGDERRCATDDGLPSPPKYGAKRPNLVVLVAFIIFRAPIYL